MIITCEELCDHSYFSRPLSMSGARAEDCFEATRFAFDVDSLPIR